MFLELERVPPEGQAVERVLAAKDLRLDREEFRLASDVELSGRLEPLDSEEGLYRFRGGLAARIELDCVRCLEPFPMDLREELDLTYLPQSRNRAPAAPAEEGKPSLDDRGLDGDELTVSFYQEDRIDLTQMLREQFVLALPMKPLCRSDCLGLCPECGTNRNTASCECAPDETDPRWSALKSLLGR